MNLLKIISKGVVGLGRGLVKGTQFFYESTKEGLEALKDYNLYKKDFKNHKDISKDTENAEDFLNSEIRNKSDIYDHLNIIDRMYINEELSKKKYSKLKDTLYQKAIDYIEEYNSPKNKMIRFWDKVASCIFIMAGVILLSSNLEFTGNAVGSSSDFYVRNILGILLIVLPFILFFHKKVITKKDIKRIFNRKTSLLKNVKTKS